MTNVYGFDIGTTYSKIAFIDENGHTENIRNSDGKYTTPSIVYFESEGNVFAGHVAKEVAAFEPERVVQFVNKLQMFDRDWALEVGGRSYKSEEIMTFFIRKLVEDARRNGHDVYYAVIAVPPYFGEIERQQTRVAGELAGLNVLVRPIDEPIAAAISYDFYADTKWENMLVYDLGGATFDASVLRKTAEGGIEFVCTDGAPQLGGKDWDNRIVEYYLERFRGETGLDIMAGDPQEVHGTVCELHLKAEEDKMQLSQRVSTRRKITFAGERATVELTRAYFEEMTNHLLDHTFYRTDLVIERAREKGVTKIDTFLLVGGSTCMPQARMKIVERYSIEPVMYSPSHVVASGAAIAGGSPQYGGWW
jgi:molecular chaperone DnaK (HSP70)